MEAKPATLCACSRLLRGRKESLPKSQRGRRKRLRAEDRSRKEKAARRKEKGRRAGALRWQQTETVLILETRVVATCLFPPCYNPPRGTVYTRGAMRRAGQERPGVRQPPPPSPHAETRPKSPGGTPKRPRPHSSKPHLALDDDAPAKEVRLFVGGLAGVVTAADVTGRFAPFGAVKGVELVRGKALGTAAGRAPPPARAAAAHRAPPRPTALAPPRPDAPLRTPETARQAAGGTRTPRRRTLTSSPGTTRSSAKRSAWRAAPRVTPLRLSPAAASRIILPSPPAEALLTRVNYLVHPALPSCSTTAASGRAAA